MSLNAISVISDGYSDELNIKGHNGKINIFVYGVADPEIIGTGVIITPTMIIYDSVLGQDIKIPLHNSEANGHKTITVNGASAIVPLIQGARLIFKIVNFTVEFKIARI